MQTLPQRLLDSARTRVRSGSGPEFWRSLEELAGQRDFQERVAAEFPEGASLWQAGPLERRRFLKLLGASLALAGMAGCSKRKREKILPYVRQPEQLIPGKPQYYASVMPWRGYARGILVESHMSRPIKIEGNPDHPFSLGTADAATQAAIAGFYDPWRLQIPYRDNVPDTWRRFESELLELRQKAQANHGARIGLLMEPNSSPTLHRQLHLLRNQWPQLKLYSHDPLASPVDSLSHRALYQFSNADVVVAIGSDFLEGLPESLRYTREFTARRRVSAASEPRMNRLYVAESGVTLTGGMADHREAMAPNVLLDTLTRIHNSISNGSAIAGDDRHDRFARDAAQDLQNHAGRSIVIVGPEQSLQAHRLAHAINAELGNIGQTLRYVEAPRVLPDGAGTLEDLVAQAQADELDALFVMSCNPAYAASGEIDVADAFRRIEWTAQLSLENDETGALCNWRLPEAHFLESWSDLLAPDGTASIQQPLIEPLYQGRSVHETLGLLLGDTRPSRIEPLMETWRQSYQGNNFTSYWQEGLRKGVIEATQAAVAEIDDPFQSLSKDAPALASPPSASSNSDTLWILFRPDPLIGDGRWANNPWLQEIPKSMTMLVWDNAAIMAPATAERFGLQNNDVVSLSFRGRSVEAPVWIMLGHDPNSVTVHLGYGRDKSDLADDRGFNAYRIRPIDEPWNASGLRLERTGRRYELVTTQEHHAMHGRHLAMHGTLTEFRNHPNFVHEKLHAPKPEETLYPKWPAGDYSWGMSIDLNVCTGCRACVAACQAENNIPVVGKEQVRRGREMHWIRVDRYYAGDPESPETLHQPVPCMHCENAPCEVVCPVAATVHGNDGLNEMVYNRCVGTRYCSNNCPYKVRRFNFLDYRQAEEADHRSVRALQHNPDVTVRMRGVMEKCTYCVQRISQARIAAKKENRRIRDGEVTPACAQTCPAEAIVFGDIGDPNTKVSKAKNSPLDYKLLAELNTRPRTTYAAALRNKKGTV